MKFLFSLCLLGMIFSAPAAAGSSQAGGESYFPVEDIVAFSKKVERSMAENRARVAIVGPILKPRPLT